MLTSLILAAVAGAAISTIIHYILLHWREIVGWFENWIAGHQSVDKDSVGFMIRESMKEGKCKFIQGVFHKSSGTVADARHIEAEDVDEQTRKNCCGKEKVTIFE